jgi:hypothetical protein
MATTASERVEIARQHLVVIHGETLQPDSDDEQHAFSFLGSFCESLTISVTSCTIESTI